MALLKFCIAKGYSIQSSDTAEGYNIQRLRSMGILCHIGHLAEHVEEAAVVVLFLPLFAPITLSLSARGNVKFPL